MPYNNLKPLNRRRLKRGPPPNREPHRVTLGRQGISLPRGLYDRFEEPPFLQLFTEGKDLVIKPAWCSEENTYRRTYFISDRGRVFYRIYDFYEIVRPGKYLFTEESSGVLIENILK